jgi:hypothetical protein
MMLSAQFPELFRQETYAVRLALMDNHELQNPFDELLQSQGITGLWDKEYSVVPIGELNGRKEGEPIPQKDMVMGYTCYGAQSIEASGKVNLSRELKGRARQFVAPEGVDEPRFAGFLADTVSRGFLSRWDLKKHRLAANIFNLGGIQAGHVFFNQRLRANGLSDLPNSNLIYDSKPLFALPANAHPSYAANAVVGPESAATGTCVDAAASIADTGGYFNAFSLPPSYWALKRVWTHFVNNMQYDENDVKYVMYPDTLLVSSHNYPKWMEILEAKVIEPQKTSYITNIPNLFMMDGFAVRLVQSPLLLKNTWYLGRAKAPGILTLKPDSVDDPWAYYRDEDNRSYFISYEESWGFMVRNWRSWCAGSISTDGTTIPTFGGLAEKDWDVVPSGV